MKQTASCLAVTANRVGRFLSRGSFADAQEDDREGIAWGMGDDAFSPRVGWCQTPGGHKGTASFLAVTIMMCAYTQKRNVLLIV